MAKKTYVLDTSVYLSSANALYSYGNNDIVVPLKVLEEIDKHKKRQDNVGHNARQTIRIFDELRAKGSLCGRGVRLDKGKGMLRVASVADMDSLPQELKRDVPDHMIIATALSENNNLERKVILVSQDINMRVIGDSLGLATQDYEPEQVIHSKNKLFSGFSEHMVDEETIDRFHAGEQIFIEKEFFPNEFLMLISKGNEKKTALAKYIDKTRPLKKVKDYKRRGRGSLGRITPRNKEQAFAMDLLLDPDIQVVSLVGLAGSGKTLAAISAGLQQIDEDSREYGKLIVSRPIQPLGRDLGYLPGSLEEKMLPWLKPIQDNIEYLMSRDRMTLESYLDQGLIEIEALSYIRGRSIANAYIIIDEAQNLTIHEMKTIITRVGDGTKIVLTGDIEQIDNIYINETSNGLTHAVEKFKNSELSGHVTLKKGERSRVATLAAEVL